MSSTLTTDEIMTHSGLCRDTVVRHARKQWLKGQIVSDVIGWRFGVEAVKRWAEKYLRPSVRTKVLKALDAPAVVVELPTALVWMQSISHDSAHLVDPRGRAVCDPRIICLNWQPLQYLKKCRRCMAQEHA